MKKLLAMLLSVLLALSMLTAAVAEGTAEEELPFHRIRTIITTDGEIDDQCSLVRYMLYANMFELEGLVSSSSRFHYLTKEGEVFKGRDSNQKWIDAYAEVYDNLCQHAEGFPTPEYLTSINVEGNITEPGEMDHGHGRLPAHQGVHHGRARRPALPAGLGRHQHHRPRRCAPSRRSTRTPTSGKRSMRRSATRCRFGLILTRMTR